MKKLTLALITGIFLFSTAMAQAPAKFRYQAVARDATNDHLLTNTAIQVDIEIFGSDPITPVFTETQSITTDDYGLFSLTIGANSSIDLNSIDWGNGPYEINIKANGVAVSTQQELQSVPYALFANEVGNKDDADADPANELQTLAFANDSISISQGNSVYVPGLPAGSIIPFAGQTLPPGWLPCDGSDVSRVTYATLFNSLGTSWGNGNGATTFNLPDFRGRFPRGWDNGAGNDPDAMTRTDIAGTTVVGDVVGSYQQDEFKAHTHTPSAGTLVVTGAGGSNYSSGSGFQLNAASLSNTGGSETRPLNASVFYIIKY